MSKLSSCNDCIEKVREQTDEVILFCSLGKDSLVTLDLIAPHFKRVVCVFMYFVKGLTHIERYVNWVKRTYPNVEFVQVPHWNLTYLLRSGLYCVPQPKIRLMKLADVVEAMKKKYGIEYIFYGMKKADSMNRRLMLMTYADNHYIKGTNAYPLAEWTQKDILAYMKQHKLPMPVRYSLKASGGVGFDIDCFLWMRENAPQDLEMIYKVFPMSQKLLFDYDNKQRQEAEITE